MRAEVVAVGTELLLGQIVNSNAQQISSALASIGVDVLRHSVVGDNLERATEELRAAAGRADVLIVTGGLGPTPDDLTREAVAGACGVELVRDDVLVGRIRRVFEELGRPMPEANLRQADVPRGARPIEPEGTAPGFMLEAPGCLIVALPGVPWEMEAMLAKDVLPELVRRAGTVTTVSREILVTGLGESHLHARIADIVAAQTSPTIAYRAGGGEVRIRLTAKAEDEGAALALIAPVETEIRRRLGDRAVEGHPGSAAGALAAALLERGATVACVESLTGGLLGVRLTQSPGAGRFFLGSIVAYAAGAKSAVAGVDPALIEEHGVVSEAVAAALAGAAAARFGADLGLAATGVAGPEELEGHPPGTVFVAAHTGPVGETRRIRGYGDRGNVRSIAATAALDLGRRIVTGVGR